MNFIGRANCYCSYRTSCGYIEMVVNEVVIELVGRMVGVLVG